MKMEKTVFNEPGLGDSLATHFVPVKLNHDQHKQLATKYGVKFLPCDLVLTPQGELVDSMQSPRTADQYVAKLTQVAVVHRPQYGASQVAAAPSGPAAGSAMPPQQSLPASNYSNQPASLGAGPVASAPVNGLVGDRYSNYQPAAEQVQGPSFGQEETPAAGPAFTPPAAGAQPPSANYNSYSDDRYGNPANAAIPPYTPQAAPANEPVSADLNTADLNTVANVAPQQVPTSQQIPNGNPPLGLDGFCPVRLVDESLKTGKWVRGDVRYGARHEGRTYLFAGPEEQQKFLASPDRYAPAMAGQDIVEYVETGRIIEGNRSFGVYYEGDGRVYLFSSSTTRDKFENDANRYITMLRQVAQPNAAPRR